MLTQLLLLMLFSLQDLSSCQSLKSGQTEKKMTTMTMMMKGPSDPLKQKLMKEKMRMVK